MPCLKTVYSPSPVPFPPRQAWGRKRCCRPFFGWRPCFPEKEAVGISFASQINPTEGYISSATGTFPGFTGLPIKALLEQELGVPVSIDNDVNCAAVGEGHQGAAAECPDFLCLTYGTGIGGAIVIGGSLYYGQTFAAGEVGHMTLYAGGLRCNCGRQGCYEA